MSKIYEEEEKRMYLDAFNVSGKTKTAFAVNSNFKIYKNSPKLSR